MLIFSISVTSHFVIVSVVSFPIFLLWFLEKVHSCTNFRTFYFINYHLTLDKQKFEIKI